MPDYVKDRYGSLILFMMSKVVKTGAVRIMHWAEVSTQRRRLLSLSDRMLEDIGISHDQARLEGARSFWDIQTNRRKSGVSTDEPRHFARFQTNWRAGSKTCTENSAK